ncbi:MAG: metal-dependent hydrolase [Acidobacteria bacterium]|nr:metal-dependent hydrolase [Acidobacteriota bacterium]
MFLGHFAVGLASKRIAPRTSAAILIAAALFADILWPIFLLFGWEHVRIDPSATRFTPLDFYDYPWSHSLLALLTWATAFALLYWRFSRYAIGALMIWVAVLSHWLLDWITHRPDMPLYPGSALFGLQLWSSIKWTMIVEFSMFVAGVCVYLRSTRARDKIGSYGAAAYFIFLTLVYVANSSGPPPPSVSSILWVGLIGGVILLLWAWWIDSHREPATASRTTG